MVVVVVLLLLFISIDPLCIDCYPQMLKEGITTVGVGFGQFKACKHMCNGKDASIAVAMFGYECPGGCDELVGCP